jgi:OmcA/MtrC family decaheme c-type cytochrome
MVVAAAATLAVTSSKPLTAVDGNSSRRRPVAAPTAPAQPATSAYTPAQMEYYLGEDGVSYIRPGLKIKINKVEIPADRRAVVDFNLTDDFDQPLDRLGKQTLGVISMSFILAHYDPATREYTSYTTRTQTAAASSPNPGNTAVQAAADSGGTFTDLELGHGTYRFAKVLPENYDKAKTTSLGIYSTRNLTDILGKNYYANVIHDFRPDGGTIAATDKWEKITSAACNNCHDPLALHGGSRREVKLCVLCHSTQTVDPDTKNSVNMAEMVHKIHYGPNLTKGYVIWGNNSTVHDYSHTTMPLDIRNCDNCHEGINSSQKPPQSNVYYTYPSRRACGACHDDIDFAGGSNHPKQSDDTQCSTCHIPDSGVEYDNSIKGAHRIPVQSKQLKGLTAEIVSATDLTPGSAPTLAFKFRNGDGSAVDVKTLTSYRPIVGGPTSSYRWFIRDSNTPASWVYDPATGTSTYKFTKTLPADAAGSVVVTGDFYRNVSLKRGDGEPDISVREAALNPIKYYSLSGGTPTARRTVVTIENCNLCHDHLAFHGGSRQVTQECVICHNPTQNDHRTPEEGGAQTISFQHMIHRIHTGEELTREYSIGDTSFNEVLFPADRRNCLNCHTGTTHTLPLPTGIDPVPTERDFYSPQGPGTVSCLSCHDNEDAAAHAYLNTTTFPGSTKPSEACATCHGTGKEWSVEQSHAR